MSESRDTNTWDAKMDTIPEEEAERTSGLTWHKLAFIILIPWNMIFCAPPLIITEEQLQEGIDVIDMCLDIADQYYEE